MEDLELGAALSLVTFKEISRRIRLETHVNRLVTAIDATPDVFLVADAEWRIAFVNPAFTSPVTVWRSVGRPDDCCAHRPRRRRSTRIGTGHQGSEWIGELVNLRRDGTYQVEATVSPISDMAGRFIGYVACERDITTRKKLEDAFRLQRDFVRTYCNRSTAPFAASTANSA